MIFEQCAACHGDEGLGTSLAPEILHPVVDYAAWLIRNGRMHPNYPLAMPSYNSNAVSDEDLTDILDWLSDAPKPTTGESLYMDYCSHCHGDDGVGTTNHDAKGRSLNEFTSNIRNGHHAGEFGNRTGYMPKWSSAELSDAEINLIHQHVNTF